MTSCFQKYYSALRSVGYLIFEQQKTLKRNKNEKQKLLGQIKPNLMSSHLD